MTHYKLAAYAFNDSLEQRERSDGSKFYCLRDDAPEWMREAAMDAHRDMIPNDWSYRLIYRMADYIASSLEDDGSSCIDRIIAEAADYAIPDYNSERLDWLCSNPSRVELLDDFLCDFGDPKLGIISAIGEAIRSEAEEIGWHLWEAFIAVEMADD